MLGSLLRSCSRKQKIRDLGNDCVTKMLLHGCENLTSNPSSHVKREKLGIVCTSTGTEDREDS